MPRIAYRTRLALAILHGLMRFCSGVNRPSANGREASSRDTLRLLVGGNRLVLRFGIFDNARELYIQSNSRRRVQ
jgi:hypothetical protein